MLRVVMLFVVLAVVWLASRQLSLRGGILCGTLGFVGFGFNLWRAWGQGLSTMEVVNYNFSETSMLLVNLISAVCCLLALLVLVRELGSGSPRS